MPHSSVYVKGRGTVVTGRIEQGTIKVGEEVEILGLTKVRRTLNVLKVFCFMVYVFVFTSFLCIE
jgi:elongation factor Tu